MSISNDFVKNYIMPLFNWVSENFIVLAIIIKIILIYHISITKLLTFGTYGWQEIKTDCLHLNNYEIKYLLENNKIYNKNNSKSKITLFIGMNFEKYLLTI